MNEDLQRKLSSLESLISTQKDCVIPGRPECDYMQGMLNGMILSHSVFTGCRPDFHSLPHATKSNSIRHKKNRNRK